MMSTTWVEMRNGYVQESHRHHWKFSLKNICTGTQTVTVVVGLVGVVIVPLPLTSVQSPVPTSGVFPAMVAVAQTVCGGPAFAGVTLASILTVRLPVSVVGEQLVPAGSRVMVSFTV